MVNEKRSLLQRLQHWLLGERKAHHADQKERRDEMATFMEERAVEQETTSAGREKRT